MQRGTAEFDDVMAAFEQTVKNTPAIPNCRLDRVGRDEGAPPSQFYESGETNMLFHAYMAGYARAKCVYQLGNA